jgi:long-chain acyl-CoA synthetase
MFSLTQMLRRVARLRPNAAATVCGERRRSYADFIERVARLAGGLRGLGLEAGDRVVMLGLNSDRYLEFYMATWWAGGIAVPANSRWAAPELAQALDDCAARFLIVDDGFVALSETLASLSPQPRIVIHATDGACAAGLHDYEQLIAQNEMAPDALRHGDDLALICYTGGTTGRPKGVMLSHANALANIYSILSETFYPEDAVILHSAPLFHIGAISLTLRMFMRGGTHVTLDAFDPVRILETIERERITQMMLVPTMIQRIIDHPRFAEFDTASFKWVGYGAAPISEALLERAMHALPQAGFAQYYGMTELFAAVTYLSWDDHAPAARARGRLRSVGRAMSGVDLIVAAADDSKVASGNVGEILVRTAACMRGYWNQPAVTAEATRGGWMHTGDAGYLDEDGYLYVVDRIKDMILSGGENIYSSEVENALAGHPSVLACAVIAIPDPEWGEAVHAIIVPHAGQLPTLDDLRAHCRTLIAAYKCPRSIELRETLPLSPAGKVLKHELRAGRHQKS